MNTFRIKPIIQLFATFAEFAEQTAFDANTCVFTCQAIYEHTIQPLNLPSAVILYEHYGSGEPTDVLIDAMLQDFHALNCQRVIAIGGGSILDIAKLLALKPLMTSSTQLFDGTVQAVKEKELILIPTTCGTGSEVTCISIAGLVAKGTKKGLATEALFADKAILIPELLYSLPRTVLITCGLDALIHALESFVSPRAHAYSELFSLEAVRLILNSYQTLLRSEHENVIMDIADAMLRASNYAGIAFSNVGVGAVHALAYPLGNQYHVAHGEACARFLSEVFYVYRQKNPTGKLHILTQFLAQTLSCGEQAAWQVLTDLIETLLPTKKLRDYGMVEIDIEQFADSVIAEQQRLLVNNYAPLSRDEIRNIFKRLW